MRKINIIKKFYANWGKSEDLWTTAYLKRRNDRWV